MGTHHRGRRGDRRANLHPRANDQRRTRYREPRDGHASPPCHARTDPRQPAAGMHCPPEELEAMIEEYYAFRGWDEDGTPTTETLERLDLDELAG
ncbi:hypothetical protein D8S78_03830 [Natrialba swarupiae]|nr:hypothetical protein [Natrialba swarupiae]